MRSSIRSVLFAFGLALPLVTSAQYYPYAAGNMSRASFVQTLMSSKGLPSGGNNCFADVHAESFAASVCGARNAGIVSGNPNGQFRPYDTVTFVEAAAMLVRAERVSVPVDSVWYRPYIEKLSEWNAIPASLNNILQPLTNTQAAELIAKVMNRSGSTSSNGTGTIDSDTEESDGGLTVSVDDTEVEPGDRVTFTIRIENERSRDIETDLNAFLDSDMEFVSASDDGEDIEDDQVEWSDVEIDEDDSETITLKVRIDSGADDGDTLRIRFETDDDEVSLRLHVNDDGDNDDDDDDDNDNADIKVSISETDDPVEEGGTITYRIRLTNDSNDDEETDVSAFLDKDTEFVSASDDGYLRSNDDEVQWNDVEVDEDETVTLLLTVRLKSNADDGDTLKLEVETDDDSDEEETRVDGDDGNDDGNEDIDISINASDSSVRVGDTVTYQIRLENNDNDDINPVIRAYLDDAMSYLTASSGGELRGDDEILWDDVTIQEDDDRTIQLTVRINDRVRSGDNLILRVTAGNDERSITIRGE